MNMASVTSSVKGSSIGLLIDLVRRLLSALLNLS